MEHYSEELPAYQKMEYLIEGSQNDLQAVEGALGNLQIDIKDHDVNYSGDKLIWEFEIKKEDMPELKKILEHFEKEHKTLIIHPMGLDDQHMIFGRILYGQ